MVTVRAQRHVAASPEVTWRVLTDWARHARWVPMTTVKLLAGGERPGVGVGARFSARTGLGPLAVDDVMEIVEWTPPAGGAPGSSGRCEVVKQGRVMLGGASFEVRPAPGGGSEVVWEERVGVAPERLTRPFGPVLKLITRGGLTSALAKMAAEAEAEARG